MFSAVEQTSSAYRRYDNYSSLGLILSIIGFVAAVGFGGFISVYYDQETGRFARDQEKIFVLQTQVERLLILAPTGRFVDTNFNIYNDPDFLKRFCFDAEDLTPNQKRTYTAPDANGTLALFSDIPTVFAPDTATYLTLTTNPVLVNERIMVLNASSFVTVDLGPGDEFQVDLADTGVTPGEYIRATLDIDVFGRVINASSNNPGSITCPTTFSDLSFDISGFDDPTKLVMFDVGGLSPFTTRTLTIQDASGTIAYLSDITGIFLDNSFTIRNAAVPTRQMQWNCAGISAATIRTMTIQNADGVVAYLSDLPTTFLDSEFAIFGSGDPTKRIEFTAVNISSSSTRTFAFPNLSGTLVLNAASQSLLDKTILDNTNQIDADAIQTAGASVDMAFVAPPSVGDVLSAGTATTGQWIPGAVSANWLPVFSNFVGMSGTPNTIYASHSAIGDYVSCFVAYDNMTRGGGSEVKFDISLPIPRLDGTFPVAPIVANGIGFANSGTDYVMLPVSGTERMTTRMTTVSGDIVFRLEFSYKLTN